LLDFGKNIGTDCPVDKIEYIDENGVTQVIDCYFKEGPNKDKSKGLAELSKDLGVQLPGKIKLDEIHEILSKHRAFQNVSQIYFIFSNIYSILHNQMYCLGYKT
jgi:hypothetical protein